MKDTSRHLLGAALLLGLTSAGLAKPPNIILILTDDQGWNNTEVPMIRSRADTRSDYYLTPSFKRLADAGMTFSQAYAPHPVCSPSRHAIQFGMTPAKLKKTTNRAGFLADPVPVNLNAVDDFLRLGVAAHLWADDDHLVAGVAQRARFLPDAAVERHRQVLDNDADAGLLFAHQQNPS